MIINQQQRILRQTVILHPKTPIIFKFQLIHNEMIKMVLRIVSVAKNIKVFNI